MVGSNGAGILEIWLGDPSLLGVSSWLEAFYLIGGAIVALIAIAELRKRVLQSRATFLLQLERRWKSLQENRKKFEKMREQVRNLVYSDHPNKSEKEQDVQLRLLYTEKLKSIKNDDPETFTEISEFWGFFETLGLMVRRRYLPFRDVYMLYKGPLLEVERATTDFIGETEKEAHVPAGLYENMLYLVKRARRCEKIETALSALKFWSS